MYEWGARQFAPTSVLTTLSYFYASRVAAKSARFAAVAHQELVSNLLLASALVSLTIVPYTVFTMLPNIKVLLARRNRIRASRASAADKITTEGGSGVALLQGEEAEETIKGIELWKAQNVGRMAIAFVSWSLGVAATILL
ncbi:hypothetical protein V8E36_003226 [Tilletia maclaganii]